MATITDPAGKHQYLTARRYIAEKSVPCRLLFSAVILSVLWLPACTLNLQPGMLVDRIKNRGPVSVSATNPYLAANQYLDFQRENNVEISQFLASRGSPAALEIQKSFLGNAAFFLYYPENGEYFIMNEGVEGWIVGGPYQLSGRKMQQIREVVKGIPVQ